MTRDMTGSNCALEPILVTRASGRTGGTLVMSLLATSPLVVFDRIYPYEDTRHFLHMLQLCLSYDCTPAPRDASRPKPALVRRLASRARKRLRIRRFSRPPVTPDRWYRPFKGMAVPGKRMPPGNLMSPRDGKVAYWKKCVVANWQLLGAELADAHHNLLGHEDTPRYYAEKCPLWAVDAIDGLLSHRVINVVRDPRDVWLSIGAFNDRRRKAGVPGMGRRARESQDEYLARFMTTQASYLLRVQEAKGSPTTFTTRYEDLVENLAGEARRLEGWLGIKLDLAEHARLASEILPTHATSANPERSVGRWRRELPVELNHRFTKELGDLLAEHGYVLA